MGRPKRKPEDTERVKTWYGEIARWLLKNDNQSNTQRPLAERPRLTMEDDLEQVMEIVEWMTTWRKSQPVDDNSKGRSYSKVESKFNKLLNKSGLPGVEKRQMKPSQDSWKKWEIGERTPSHRKVKRANGKTYERHMAEFIDSVIMEAGGPSLSWILSEEGKITLSPIFAWDPFKSGLEPKQAIQTAIAHFAAYKYLPTDDQTHIIEITSRVCRWPKHSYKTTNTCHWPPIMMVPKGVENTLPSSPSIPLQWLDIVNPRVAPSDKFNDLHYENAMRYQAWSTTKGHMNDGLSWLAWLKILPMQALHNENNFLEGMWGYGPYGQLMSKARLAAMQALDVKTWPSILEDLLPKKPDQELK